MPLTEFPFATNPLLLYSSFPFLSSYDRYGKGGYTCIGKESAAKSTGTSEETLPDLVESYEIRGKGDIMDLPDKIPETMIKRMQPYWEHVRDLSVQLLRLSEMALGLDKGHLDAIYKPIQMDTRLAYYPVVDGVAPKRQFGYGAHTDYTGFTVLRAQEGIKVGLWRPWLDWQRGFCLDFFQFLASLRPQVLTLARTFPFPPLSVPHYRGCKCACLAQRSGRTWSQCLVHSLSMPVTSLATSPTTAGLRCGTASWSLVQADASKIGCPS